MLIAVPDHWHIAIDDRRVERRQGRLRREAADAEDRGRAGDRQGGARQQARLPGRHAAALGPALPAGQAGVLRHRQARQGHARAHLVARQHLSTCGRRRPRSRRSPPTWTGRSSSGPLKWRDYDPQQYYNWRAYLDLRRRPDHRSVHALDRRRAHVHGRRHPDRGVGVRAASITTRTAAPRPTRSTCCSSIRRSSPRRSRRRSRPGLGGAAIEFCGTQGRLWITRGRYEYYDVPPPPAAARITPPDRRSAATGDRGPGVRRAGPGSHAELPGLRRLAQAAERRRADRPPLGPGLAPRQHRVSREAADQVRSGARAISSACGRCSESVWPDGHRSADLRRGKRGAPPIGQQDDSIRIHRFFSSLLGLPKGPRAFSLQELRRPLSSSRPFMPSSIEIQPSKPTSARMRKIAS